MVLRLLVLLLLLAGCAQNAPDEPGQVNVHMNGTYMMMGGVGLSH